MQLMPLYLDVLDASDDFTTARIDDLLLQIWHSKTTAPGVASFRAGVAAVANRYGSQCRVLVLVERTATLPEKEEREQIASVMQDYRRAISAAALVHEGEGFVAASVRAVVTGLNLLTLHPFPYKVFNSVSQAFAWGPMATGGGVDLVQSQVLGYLKGRQDLSIAS